jgi:hypothetical protein
VCGCLLCPYRLFLSLLILVQNLSNIDALPWSCSLCSVPLVMYPPGGVSPSLALVHLLVHTPAVRPLGYLWRVTAVTCKTIPLPCVTRTRIHRLSGQALSCQTHRNQVENSLVTPGPPMQQQPKMNYVSRITRPVLCLFWKYIFSFCFYLTIHDLRLP